MVEYEVVEIGVPGLEDELNRRAGDGWRLHTAIPLRSLSGVSFPGYRLILERTKSAELRGTTTLDEIRAQAHGG